MEIKIVDCPDYVNIKRTEIILEQMKKSICKINKGNGERGTGFFCKIPYQNKILKVLVTNYHIIDENYIKTKDKINLAINDNDNYINISLENDRKIYLSEFEKEDIAIIEIKDKEHSNKINFLELDNRLLNENSESIYTSENSIYIIQYPNASEACVSYGILKLIKDHKLIHKCSTEKGSSGSPILNLKTNQVIGLHQGHLNESNNLGIFLKFPIQNLNNKMKIIGEIKNNINNNINYNNINNKNHHNSNSNNNSNNNLLNIKNNGNIYNKKQKEDFDEGLLENVEWNKNEYITERYIEDGIYNIFPKHCNNRAIDIDYASNENKANLQLYEYNNTNAQKFEVKYNYEHKYYTIKCLCSNKFLSVDYKNNYNIVQYEENNKINQQWHIVLRDRSYEIISEIKGYLMNVDGFGDNLGTNISCYQRRGGLNQQFQFEIPPNQEGKKYFKKPVFHGEYSNINSIVDGLKSIGEDSSFDYRSTIAIVNEIVKDFQDYKENNVKANLAMIDLLKKGELKKP